MNLYIRPAVLSDAAACAEIHCRGWEVAYSGFIPAELIAQKNAARHANWPNYLVNGRFEYYVSVLEGKVVGFLSLRQPDEHENLPGYYYEVGGLYLHPSVFRQGIGRKLMAFAEEQARAKGKTAMMLWVFEDNAPARRFYEACGYHPDGAADTHEYGRTLRALRYVKDLMNLEIRKAAIDDASALAQAHIRSWRAACEGFIPAKAVAEFCANRPQRWRENLSREGHTTHVALLDGKIAGFFSFGTCRDDSLDDSYYMLYTIYIDPNFQHKGIGRRLMAFAEEQARAVGKRAMVIKVFAKNKAARRFYEVCGYRRHGRGTVRKDYGRRLRVLRYEKEL